MPNELTPNAAAWTPAQSRAQFAAIAQLRWRMLLNGFRRKGGTGELVARIITYPILAGFALGPSIGVYVGAFYFTSSGHLNRISWLLWGTFFLCQLLNIQLGQPGTMFDPTQLIRFPLRVPGYTAIRLFFGLLSPANIVGTLMSVSIALGVIFAQPGLWLYASVALGVFASANVLFSRMVFAWVDRWLSTRRAREIFTAVGFAFAVGIQYVNVTFNTGFNNRHYHASPIRAQSLIFFLNLYHRAQPFLQVLPPELTARSLVGASVAQPLSYLSLTLGCALFSAVFLAVFTLRMAAEFRGENLSDAANAVAGPKKVTAQRAAIVVAPASAPPARSMGWLPPALSAMLGKEVLYMRRNLGILYAVVMPTVFVFLFAGRMAGRVSSPYIFPGAVAYTLLGIAPLSYNSWGFEGAGSQFYLLAPVRLRDVFLAKNMLGFALACLEMLAVFGIITYVSAMPSLQTAAVAVLWAAGTLLISTTIGNRRSISSPKKVVSQRMKQQASPLSGLISMGVLLLTAGVAAALLVSAVFLHFEWVLVPAFAVYAGVAAFFYWRSLGGLDRFVLDHREELFAELCKAS
jgi:ABC-2 type transport system permease protein